MFNVAGVISVIVFYILILVIGIWASRKQSSAKDVNKEVKSNKSIDTSSAQQYFNNDEIKLQAANLFNKYIGRSYACRKKYWDVCRDLYHDSNLGWRRVYQWNG